MANNKRGFDATQTAEDWKALKVYTVPLRPRSKRPKNTDWPSLRLTGKKISNAFQIGDNIGGLWGEPSNWIIDVDLDTQEACDVAPHILPETFIYGRRDKPHSHYLFRCVGIETKKWQIKEIGTIIEIRSTGAQSVLPPSVHPDGDRYQTYHDVEFYDIPRKELQKFANEIAIAAIFVRFYPDAGSRHDYVHTCTGTLCHAQWEEEKVRRVMAAMLSVVQDEDEELKDRLGAVVNTIEHFKLGDRIQGFKTLEAWMDMQTIQALRKWTMVGGTKDSRVLTLVPPTSKESTEKEFDEKWLEVPGLIGDIAKWAGKRAFIRQPSFDLATALMCTAITTTNNYLVDSWDTPLQPYLMITAPTGDGKGAVLSAIQQFAHELELDEYVYRGFQSYYSMLDELAEPPNMAVWLWDEAARHMASAKSASGQDFQVLSHVISLYGQANEYVPGTPGRKQPIPPLERPYLLILATAQPDQLMESLTSAAEETGFVNRFTLFDSGIEFPFRNRRRSKTFPSAIKKIARRLRDHEPAQGEVTPVKFDDAKTWALFDDYEEAARRRSHRGEKVWARANQNALIIAGLGAVGVDPDRPKITKDLARWAIEITTWSNDRWTEKVRLTGGDSIHEKESFRVEERIRNPHKYGRSAQSNVHKSLIKRGFMPHSILLRLTRSIQRHRLEAILDDLHDAEIIGSSEIEENVVYFSK